MDLYILQKNYLNKRVLIIALILGLFINIAMLGGFEYYISKVKPIEPPKEPVVKLIEIKEKKKIRHKKRVKKVVKKKIVKKKRVKKKRKPVARVPKAAKKAKKALTPAATMPLPQVENLSEKEIALPEKEVEVPYNTELAIRSKKLAEAKAPELGKPTPMVFGKKLSQLFKGTYGTGAERYILYQPETPKISSSDLPPTVKVKIFVNPDGTVGRVDILTAIPDKKIYNEIWNYIKRWKFNPIEENEIQWAIVKIRFKPEG